MSLDPHLAAYESAARAIAEAETLDEAVEQVLVGLCEALRWDLGNGWMPDESQILRCKTVVTRGGPRYPAFEEATRRRSLAPGKGIPGCVMQSGNAMWLEEIATDSRMERSAAARADGLRTAVAFPIRLGGDVLGVLEMLSHEARPPDARVLALLESIGSLLGLFIRRARESALRARLQERLAFAGEASRCLGETLDFEKAITTLVRLAVPTLADWCAIEIVREDGCLEQIAVAHSDPSKVALARELRRRWPSDPASPFGAHAVIRTGRSQLMADIPDELTERMAKDPEHLRLLRDLGLRSYLIVPIARRGRVFGALALVIAESHRRFDEGDLAIAEEFAARAASALENARLYRDAQDANQLKDEFLATLSHELRTPLNAILGWSHMLRKGTLDEASRAKALEIIERNARLQTQVVNDVLDVSRIVAGKLRLDVQDVEPAKLVAGALEGIRLAAEGKRIHVEAHVDPSAGVILGDAARLQQVVWNLLSNGVKFTNPGGEVRVDVSRTGDQVEIRVTDTGRGIDPAFLPYVFDRFRQGDSSPTREHAGLGLGLAIVRHLVEIHGGTVTAQSAGKNEGATFAVRLPSRPVKTKAGSRPAPVRAVLAPASEGAMPRLDGLRVLVVDDQHDAREVVAEVLRQAGVYVETAESAASALDHLEQGRHGMLVSDIGMPDGDGYSLIRAVRTSHEDLRGIPALALTAFARSEDRQKALAEGFNAHMPKPIEPALLLRAVAGLTGRA